MLLIELLSSPTSYKWVKHSDNAHVATFNINDITYITDIGYDDDNNSWDISFTTNKQDPNHLYDLTGTGNSITVFSTVTDIVSDFTHKYHPHRISFTARGNSRKKFYDRWAKSLTNKLPGDWNLRIVDRATRRYILNSNNQKQVG